jgi:DNA-binding transcriptional LysR family regulator
MSKLERITAFIAVVEANGFAAAARQQGVSTAAISRMVSNLEADLNTQLLKRTTRSVALTEVGATYYEQAKQALSDLNSAEQVITASMAEAAGLLRITSNRYFAINHLFPDLPQFMAENPKLRVQIELAERFPDLAQEKIDIIFGVSAEGPEELVRRRVGDTRYVLCASPAYLAEHGTPQVPADLIKHRYIAHSMRKPNNVLVFKNGQSVQVEPFLFLNDSRAMSGCAMKDMGIVGLHDYVVNEALANGQLIEVLAKFQEPIKTIYLYYEKSRYLQPKIRRFIDFYVERSSSNLQNKSIVK